MSRVTIYSLDVLLFLFGTSPLLHCSMSNSVASWPAYRFLTLQADSLLTATREGLWLPIIYHTYFCFIDYAKAFDFLLAIFIPACASSSPVFLMMYSAYKLNEQGDNIQPWCTPFPIWNQSVVPCPVLTVASWPAYKFIKRQIRWSGIPISFRIFPVCCDPHS